MNDHKIIYCSKNPWIDNEEPKPEVFAKPLSSPAKDYHVPTFNKVSTKIKADCEKYIPNYDINSTEADLFANLKSEFEKIGHSSCLIVDCGFDLEMPIGYRIKINSNESLKNNGIFASHFLDQSCYNNKSIRIKVSLINVYQNIFTIKKDDKIAKISIEPVYIFDWYN